ncbi:919_t:CDS:2, partial [Ambispora leptoticha]
TRASLAVKRHYPRVVKIVYKSPDQSKVKENLFFVGKGVTYDTGGADIKAGGHMRGMSRDKCGAATVAGFLKTVSKLQPVHVNVTAALALVRNSVGSDSYVSDEVIYSRAGVRVLVGNTDAEGRMVMADLLTECKELALKNTAAPSRLFTVATLTGHALLAYGNYGAVIDNGPARKAGISQRVIQAGHIWGDPFELSTLRREDYEFIKPRSNREDVVQANESSSMRTIRGHQYPAAFLIIASGLKDHGLKAPKDRQISYSHLDIAGNSETRGKGLSLGTVTGSSMQQPPSNQQQTSSPTEFLNNVIGRPVLVKLNSGVDYR